ncbi:MAG: VOC family protein [Pseudomonadota bacterium]
MPKLLEQAPVLLVSDIKASLAYWRQSIGFTFAEYGEPETTFAIGKRDSCFIMLSQAPEGHTITPHWKVVDTMWNAYFWVDDAQALYEEFLGSGAKIDYSLCEQPYNVLEFGIQDLDGHDIAFGQDLG